MVLPWKPLLKVVEMCKKKYMECNLFGQIFIASKQINRLGGKEYKSMVSIYSIGLTCQKIKTFYPLARKT